MQFSIRPGSAADMTDVVRIDDDATLLYAEAGIVISLAVTHPFTVDERSRWTHSAESGRLFIAEDARGVPVGFAAFEPADGQLYLDQLSVVRAAMKNGIGRALLRRVVQEARSTGHDFLWLTTYSHLAWNRPFYEREGLVVVPESECGPRIRHHIEDQRRFLPVPEERIAMRKDLRVSP
jgi:GNAT superfamily N-acetyltransferase